MAPFAMPRGLPHPHLLPILPSSPRNPPAAPLLLQVFTCGAMRHSPPSVEQRVEAALAEAAFKQMDKGGHGKLSKRDLLPVLATLGIQGSPPQVAEATLWALLQKYAAGADEMGREPFNELFVQLVAGMVDPLHTGASAVPQFPPTPTPIARPCSLPRVLAFPLLAPRQILASKEKMASETFAELDMESLLSYHITIGDVDSSSDFVDRGKFSALFPALLTSLVAHLEHNPLVLKVSLLKDLPVGGEVLDGNV
ncbi:unnamed protein product [Closterium sp. Naga37s-1]|nr:unnamed protein product [Closterium sp. Naga37s-1]